MLFKVKKTINLSLALTGLLTFATQSLAQEFNDNFTVRLYLANAPLSYEVAASPQFIENNDQATPSTLLYSTNTLAETGISIGYKGYSLSLGQPVKPSASNIESKGTTEGASYRITYNKGLYNLEVFHKDETGFYIANPTQVDPTWNSTKPYPQIPNMNMKNSGFQSTFVLHPKSFSLPALLDQSEKQKQSGGSFLGALGAEITNVSNPNGPLIYDSHQQFYSENGSMDWTKVQSMYAKLGGGYTLVWEEIYLGGTLLFGGTYYSTSNSNTSKNRRDGQAIARSANLGLGYNTSSGFFGVNFSNTSTDVLYKEIRTTTSRAIQEFFMGYRF